MSVQSIERYIANETDPRRLYDGVRERLARRMNYPEDWEIKRLQRLADARYSVLMKREGETHDE